MKNKGLKPLVLYLPLQLLIFLCALSVLSDLAVILVDNTSVPLGLCGSTYRFGLTFQLNDSRMMDMRVHPRMA